MGCFPRTNRGDKPGFHSRHPPPQPRPGSRWATRGVSPRGWPAVSPSLLPPSPAGPPLPPRYLRAAVRGSGGLLLLLLLLLPARLEAARWRWRWRRRQPGGRGRSARLAPLLPREAQGTLSRAAAPRPVCSLGLGAHGGAARPRAREV